MVAVGLLVGAAAGLAVYQGSRLSGRSLFVLCGTTAGGVAAVVIHGYTRTIRLTEITLSIPQLTDLRFAVTKDNKAVAWRLFVETVTRVSLQPMDAASGLIREALNSLYALFTITREVLTQTQPSRGTGGNPTVEHLAIAMLNNELRPFLSTWHPRMRAWEQQNPGIPDSRWPDGGTCRRDLASMQQRLVRYAAAFGELAGVANGQEVMKGTLTPDLVSTTALVRGSRLMEPPVA